jgi:hypothetical protein
VSREVEVQRTQGISWETEISFIGANGADRTVGVLCDERTRQPGLCFAGGLSKALEWYKSYTIP